MKKPKKSKLKATRLRGGASMTCPRCDKPSHVVITRRQDGFVVRVRQCVSDRCGKRFTTREHVQP